MRHIIFPLFYSFHDNLQNPLPEQVCAFLSNREGNYNIDDFFRCDCVSGKFVLDDEFDVGEDARVCFTDVMNGDFKLFFRWKIEVFDDVFQVILFKICVNKVCHLIDGCLVGQYSLSNQFPVSLWDCVSRFLEYSLRVHITDLLKLLLRAVVSQGTEDAQNLILLNVLGVIDDKLFKAFNDWVIDRITRVLVFNLLSEVF